ncbi:glycoside hydrolase family 130 protein [Flavobacterium sp.]|uniref:glycoside hydrolase family 130 protein n=1 Tax=Flavobacterium sp. TaxID=239 RepID=UPI003C4316A0
MSDIAKRFSNNPILIPKNIEPTSAELQVICLLNPGVFRFKNKIYLLVRVAESITQKEGVVFFPVINDNGKIEIIEVPLNDPHLIATDARVMQYKGLDYLTTLSHLRLMESEDGIKFTESLNNSLLTAIGTLEQFGIEDCRVSQIGNTYYLTYTAVSNSGVGVGLRTTTNWVDFTHHGMIFPPHNKDCAIFEELINGKYYALHRPSSVQIGGNFIWIAESIDGIHWGNHKFVAGTRKEMWDSVRIGAGAAPIKTEYGWLQIYHGADVAHRYCLGALLLDLNDPSKVISRTEDPIMIPKEDYEISGFFGHVVFTNGHIIDGDKLTIYYGAADEFICGADFSIKEILSLLKIVS